MMYWQQIEARLRERPQSGPIERDPDDDWREAILGNYLAPWEIVDPVAEATLDRVWDGDET